MDPAQVVAHLQTMPLFEGFSADELRELAGLLQERRYTAGEAIFRQGDLPLALYMVVSGQVRESGVDRAGREVFRRTASPGECFGRYALVLGRPQRATAHAVGDVRLLELSSREFNRLLLRHPELRERLLPLAVAGRLRAMPVFRELSNEEIVHVAGLVEEHAVTEGQMILRAGGRDAPLYVILSGQVTVTAAGGEEVLTAGNFFGGEEVLTGRLSSVSATALTAAELYALPAEDLRWLLQAYPPLRQTLVHPDIAGRLRATTTFARLSDAQLRHLAGYVRWVHYPRGHTVVSQGQPGMNFFILDRGEAIVRAVDEQGRERPRGYLQEGDSFGETSLFVGDPHDVSVEAATGTDWLMLNREDFRLAQSARPEIRGQLRLRPETERRLRLSMFPWLEAGEAVVEQVRRHVIIAVRNLIVPVLIALVLLMLMADERLPRPLGWWLLVLDIPLGLWLFNDWWNDRLVITPRRITRWERIWPAYERRPEAPLRQVQDVRVSRGLWGSLLNYGHLQIQTAATEGLIDFTFTPEPMRIKEIIMERVARARAPERAEYREAARRGLESRLEIGLERHAPERAVPAESVPAATPPRRPERSGWRFWPWITKVEPDRITWRKHWLRLILNIWWPLLACLFLIGVAILVGFRKLPFVLSRELAFWIPWLLLMFLAFFWLWWQYTDWGNDIYVVTKERIIDIEKKPLFFAEERREASLGMVQNVNVDIPNPIAYLLGFGHVFIYTAAEVGKFDFLYVPHPREVQAEIFRRIEDYRRREAQRQAEQRQAEMAEWFEMYHRFTAGTR
ncbi:MAG: cyclic nucleotide-binding domain-containing protein [Anaerolineae bacterium]|nr:cyclic nucleotide-binding domain-containing protein [Anaerolineae bacterium]